jgi:hypothetical protein
MVQTEKLFRWIDTVCLDRKSPTLDSKRDCLQVRQRSGICLRLILPCIQKLFHPLHLVLVRRAGYNIPIGASADTNVCRNSWGSVRVYSLMTFMNHIRYFVPWALYKRLDENSRQS